MASYCSECFASEGKPHREECSRHCYCGRGLGEEHRPGCYVCPPPAEGRGEATQEVARASDLIDTITYWRRNLRDLRAQQEQYRRAIAANEAMCRRIEDLLPLIAAAGGVK